MKRDIFLWQFSAFTFVCVIGSLLHFAYSWTNFTPLAIISSVNESTFEHIKILFFPMFIYAIIEWFYFKDYYKGFWCVKLKGITLGIILIPTLFYTLTGIFGTLKGFLNILIFFISALIPSIYEGKLLKENKSCKFEFLAFIIICLMAILFALFTFFTPKIPLFLDPITKTYGISAQVI